MKNPVSAMLKTGEKKTQTKKYFLITRSSLTIYILSVTCFWISCVSFIRVCLTRWSLRCDVSHYFSKNILYSAFCLKLLSLKSTKGVQKVLKRIMHVCIRNNKKKKKEKKYSSVIFESSKYDELWVPPLHNKLMWTLISIT